MDDPFVLTLKLETYTLHSTPLSKTFLHYSSYLCTIINISLYRIAADFFHFNFISFPCFLLFFRLESIYVVPFLRRVHVLVD